MSGSVEIIGQRELAAALNSLPGKVVKKIMDRWTLNNARRAAAAGRAAAPRDRRPSRNKPESARLWRVIKGSQVRRLGAFRGQISRAIAYGARSTSRYTAKRRRAAAKANARRGARPVMFGPTPPRGGHFHLVNLGTRRRQTRSGANRGVMPANPFFARVTRPLMEKAKSEVAGPLRVAYDQAIQAELRRLVRAYR